MSAISSIAVALCLFLSFPFHGALSKDVYLADEQNPFNSSSLEGNTGFGRKQKVLESVLAENEFSSTASDKMQRTTKEKHKKKKSSNSEESPSPTAVPTLVVNSTITPVNANATEGQNITTPSANPSISDDKVPTINSNSTVASLSPTNATEGQNITTPSANPSISDDKVPANNSNSTVASLSPTNATEGLNITTPSANPSISDDKVPANNSNSAIPSVSPTNATEGQNITTPSANPSISDEKVPANNSNSNENLDNDAPSPMDEGSETKPSKDETLKDDTTFPSVAPTFEGGSDIDDFASNEDLPPTASPVSADLSDIIPVPSTTLDKEPSLSPSGNLSSTCNKALSCSECYENGETILKMTENKNSCAWNSKESKCFYSTRPEMQECSRTIGKNTVTILIGISVVALIYCLRDFFRTRCYSGHRINTKTINSVEYNRVPLGNDNSDLDWDWDDDNFKSNEISFQNDFNKKEDDDLKKAMALSLQEEGSIARVDSWDEPLTSPRSNTVQKVSHINPYLVRSTGESSVSDLSSGRHVNTSQAKPVAQKQKNTEVDIFETMGISASLGKSNKQASTLKKNIISSRSKWGRTADQMRAKSSPLNSSANTPKVADLLDENDVEGNWGDDDLDLDDI